MKQLATFLLLLGLAFGCASRREVGSYVYSDPVVVTVTSLRPTNDYCVASVAITNVSESPVWFDGWDAHHPVYSFEWKGRYYDVPSPPDEDSCIGGGNPFKLLPGQACSFPIIIQRHPETLEPFRVGAWVWPYLDKSIPIRVYWSDYVSK